MVAFGDSSSTSSPSSGITDLESRVERGLCSTIDPVAVASLRLDFLARGDELAGPCASSVDRSMRCILCDELLIPRELMLLRRPLPGACAGLSSTTSDDPSERLVPAERLPVGCGGRSARTSSSSSSAISSGPACSSCSSRSDVISYGSDPIGDLLLETALLPALPGRRSDKGRNLFLDELFAVFGATCFGVVCVSATPSSSGSGAKRPNEISST